MAGARDRAQRGELLFGTVDTFLMWHLSRGEIFATDYTNASRTMLFNIHTLDWDDELLKLFGIPRRMLPSVHPSGFDYGVTFKSILGESVPILGVAGDQQAALFGQLCVESGSLKNTYGTGCFALANTGSVPIRSAHGLLTTLAAGTDKKPQFALEGSVFVGGAVVKWLRDELRMIKKPKKRRFTQDAWQTREAFTSCLHSWGWEHLIGIRTLAAPSWGCRAVRQRSILYAHVSRA